MTDVVTRLVVRADGSLAVLDQFERKMSGAGAATDKATAANDRNTGGVARLEAAIQKMNDAAQRGLAISTESVARRSKEQAAFERMAGTIDKSYGLRIRLEREAEKTAVASANAVALGYIDQAQALDLVMRQEREHIALLEQQANAGNRVVASGIGGGANRAHTTNLMFQAQDVAMMTMLGQAPGMMAMQQGPQIAGIIQQIGNGRQAVQALGSAVLSLISPISLATIAAVALGAAGVQAFMAWVAKAGPVRRTMEEHTEWLNKTLKGYDDLQEAVSTYIDKAGKMPAGMARLELAQGLNEDIKRLQEVEQMMANFRIRDDAFLPLDSINEDLSVIRQFKTELDNGGMSAEEFAEKMMLISVNPNVNGDARQIATSLLSGAREASGLQIRIEAARMAMAGLTGEALRAAQAMATLDGTFAMLGDGAGVNGGLQNILDGQTEALESLQGMIPDVRTAQQQAAEQLALALASPSQALRDEAQAAYDLFIKNSAIMESRSGAKAAQKPFDQWGGNVEQFQQRIASQRLEIDLIGQSTYEIERQKAAFDLLNQAKQAGIPITSEVTEQINLMSAEYAKTTDELAKSTEAFNFYKGTFKGFIADMKSGLQEGQSFWEALGNAGANALDKIADKALSMAANGIWDMIFGAVMGGLGGGFGTIGIGGVGIPSGGFIPGLTGPSLPSFAGGGDTGYGPRSGGLDGQGGFLAMLHPRETVRDWTRPAANHTQANDNSRSGDLVINNVINVPAGTSPETAPALAREITKEIKRQLPDAITKFNANPLRRAG